MSGGASAGGVGLGSTPPPASSPGTTPPRSQSAQPSLCHHRHSPSDMTISASAGHLPRPRSTVSIQELNHPTSITTESPLSLDPSLMPDDEFWEMIGWTIICRFDQAIIGNTEPLNRPDLYMVESFFEEGQPNKQKIRVSGDKRTYGFAVGIKSAVPAGVMAGGGGSGGGLAAKLEDARGYPLNPKQERHGIPPVDSQSSFLSAPPLEEEAPSEDARLEAYRGYIRKPTELWRCNYAPPSELKQSIKDAINARGKPDPHDLNRLDIWWKMTLKRLERAHNVTIKETIVNNSNGEQAWYEGPGRRLLGANLVASDTDFWKAKILAERKGEQGVSYYPKFTIRKSVCLTYFALFFNHIMAPLAAFKGGRGVYGVFHDIVFKNLHTNHEKFQIGLSAGIAFIGSITSWIFYYANMKAISDQLIEFKLNRNPEYSAVEVKHSDDPETPQFPNIKEQSNWETLLTYAFGFGYMLGTTGMVSLSLFYEKSDQGKLVPRELSSGVMFLYSAILFGVSYMGMTTGTHKSKKIVKDFKVYIQRKKGKRNPADVLRFKLLQLIQKFIEMGLKALFVRLEKEFLDQRFAPDRATQKAFELVEQYRLSIEDTLSPNGTDSKQNCPLFAISILENELYQIQGLLDRSPDEHLEPAITGLNADPEPRARAASTHSLLPAGNDLLLTQSIEVQKLYLGASFWHELLNKLFCIFTSGLAVVSNFSGSLHLIGLFATLIAPAVTLPYIAQLLLAGFFTVAPFSLNLESADDLSERWILAKWLKHKVLGIQINEPKPIHTGAFIAAITLALIQGTNGFYYTALGNSALTNSLFFNGFAGVVTSFFMVSTKIMKTYDEIYRVFIKPKKNPVTPQPKNALRAKYEKEALILLGKELPGVREACDSQLWKYPRLNIRELPERAASFFLQSKISIVMQRYLGLKKMPVGEPGSVYSTPQTTGAKAPNTDAFQPSSAETAPAPLMFDEALKQGMATIKEQATTPELKGNIAKQTISYLRDEVLAEVGASLDSMQKTTKKVVERFMDPNYVPGRAFRACIDRRSGEIVKPESLRPPGATSLAFRVSEPYPDRHSAPALACA